MTEEQYQRTVAYLNFDPDVMHANCEDCGKKIPVELTRCEECEYGWELV